MSCHCINVLTTAISTDDAHCVWWLFYYIRKQYDDCPMQPYDVRWFYNFAILIIKLGIKSRLYTTIYDDIHRDIVTNIKWMPSIFMSTHLPALTKCFKQNLCQPCKTPLNSLYQRMCTSPPLSSPPFQPSTHNVCHGVTWVKEICIVTYTGHDDLK